MPGFSSLDVVLRAADRLKLKCSPEPSRLCTVGRQFAMDQFSF